MMNTTRAGPVRERSALRAAGRRLIGVALTAAIGGPAIAQTGDAAGMSDGGLIILANPEAAKLPPDQLEQLKLQVLRQLIDETLQIQQAKTADITISEQQISASFAQLAGRFGQKPDTFDAFLRQNGSSARSVR